MGEHMYQEVLDFIANFNQSEEVQDLFMNSCCLWFATILNDRFDERGDYLVEIFHEPVEGHFVAGMVKKVDGKWQDEYSFFDVRGDVTNLYDYDQLDNMWVLRREDPDYYLRLMRDCYDFVPGKQDIYYYPV